LATTGSSTAPFVGLLGTVWGIYHALIKIGASRYGIDHRRRGARSAKP
jgi:biopolymer transport protein ExbB/TolQ